MAHHIYHTEGIVLRSSPTGEANKMLVIYTRELGLVFAAVRGIRLLKSKLRFALADFSYAKIDMVRGRDIWRVTSAEPVENFAIARSHFKQSAIIGNVAKLIERLCAGEDANPAIFEDTISAFYFLNQEELIVEAKEVTELTLVLRILNNLGYIGTSEALRQYLSSQYDPAAIDYKNLEKKTILFEINRALHESQL